MTPADASLIGPDTNVEALLDRFPVAATVFLRRRMHCVGCSMARFETIADVCAIYRQPLQAMLADLNAAVRGGAHAG
ncbi:DUF1858 domain-containing protein [Sphaerobacter thermophilus]|uniref:DUF1858 domain-containing protein n=1 Tax=Sphaerobacter thermophilus (strain ATCC 49802 / DSM 20745 / KCCM 41009 / NCIMB 13125 / S 6022) TaxID=479434 RepID=D1C1E9_SPHTD|nr:DUF1858 domain-containing protein [Sphaerobacter thermophilus]ACZ38066.1 hypothetical protein Sthe_0629 [Sphaerobacter thermophilus DSM 20745]